MEALKVQEQEETEHEQIVDGILRNKMCCVHILPITSPMNELSFESELSAASLCCFLVEINSAEVTLCNRDLRGGGGGWGYPRSSELWDYRPGFSPKGAFDTALGAILLAMNEEIAELDMAPTDLKVVLFEASRTVELSKMNDTLRFYLNITEKEAADIQHI